MNKKEIENKIKALEKQLEELKNEVNSPEFEGIKKGVRERPKIGEIYYFLGDNGRIYNTEWGGSEEDLFRFNTGNCFETEQEAEEHKENLITKQQLKDLALELNKGVEIDWKDGIQQKYCIYFDYKTLKLQYTFVYLAQYSDVCCLDNQFLTIAKDRIGEEKLIKLIKSGI